MLFLQEILAEFRKDLDAAKADIIQGKAPVY
jgi:hypothetical protein